MSQTELAQHLGVSPTTLRRWELGRHGPDSRQRKRTLLAWFAEDIPRHSISIYELNGTLIRNARLSRGMGTRQLANCLGIGVHTLREFERGETTTPRYYVARAIRDWLEKEVSDFHSQSHIWKDFLDPANIGGRIAEKRRKFAMTEEELADLCGITSSTVQKWESGERFPSPTYIPKVLEWFTSSTIPLRINGDSLRSTRVARGMSRPQLAQRLGVHVASVIRWENDVTTPRTHAAIRDIRAWLEESPPEYPMTEIFDPDFGLRVQKKRLDLGITQEELAEYLGVSRQTLSKWENGVYIPRLGASDQRDQRIVEWLHEDLPVHEMGGDRIRNLRLASGMSQTDLARLLGVPSVTVGLWERGQVKPSGASRRRLAEWLEKAPRPEYPVTAMFDSGIGLRIRERRSEWGISRGELAKRLGVKENTLAGWETMRRKPRAKNAPRILEWLSEDVPADSYREIKGIDIKNARLASAMSQPELATLLGVSLPAIQNWEADRVKPQYDLRQRLADWLEESRPEYPPTELLESDLGGRIKARRVECGMTQKELGQRLGVSQDTICQWETKGKIPKKPSMVPRLLEWFSEDSQTDMANPKAASPGFAREKCRIRAQEIWAR